MNKGNTPKVYNRLWHLGIEKKSHGSAPVHSAHVRRELRLRCERRVRGFGPIQVEWSQSMGQFTFTHRLEARGTRSVRDLARVRGRSQVRKETQTHFKYYAFDLGFERMHVLLFIFLHPVWHVMGCL